ncbi:MAG TPA: hypothetical protein VIL86_05195, partial [Tepidisphaeraceae bacterium]
GGQGGNREKYQELAKSREDLMASAPKGDDAAKQIKAVLTEDQNKQLDAKAAELEKQRAEMRDQMNLGGRGFGGGQGGQGGQGGPGARGGQGRGRGGKGGRGAGGGAGAAGNV